MQRTRSKWFQPVFAVTLGVVMLGAQAIGGHPLSGLGSLGIMVAFAAVLLFGGRSETIRGLRGDGRDERFRQIDTASPCRSAPFTPTSSARRDARVGLRTIRATLPGSR
jgi:hypothetical protein